MAGFNHTRRRPARRVERRRGFTLVEMLIVMVLVVTVLGMGIPLLLTGLDEYRTASAARYLAGRFRLARASAVRRSATVALRFQDSGGIVRYAEFLDGNRNGVRTADIARGVDRRLTDFEAIGDHFPGVTFGFQPGVPAIGETSVAWGDRDPLQIGRSGIMSFTSDGCATSGTLYLRGRRTTQFAVRVLGATARTRVLKFEPVSRAWIER